MNSPLDTGEISSLISRSVSTVLLRQFGLVASERAESPSSAPDAENTVESSVALQGERIEGWLLLRLPAKLASDLYQRLTGQGTPAAEGSQAQAQAQDLATETSNILAGHVAAALRATGRGCDLGIPQLDSDRSAARSPNPGQLQYSGAWNTELGWLAVDVHLRASNP